MLLTVSGPPEAGRARPPSCSPTPSISTTSAAVTSSATSPTNAGYTPSSSINSPRKNDEIDRDLDRRLEKIAVDADDLVLESRLPAGWPATRPTSDSGSTHRRGSGRTHRRARGERPRPRDRGDEGPRGQRGPTLRGVLRDRHPGSDDLRPLGEHGPLEPDAVLDMLVTAVERYDAAGDEGKALVDLETDF